MPTDGSTTATPGGTGLPVWHAARTPAAVSLAISLLVHGALIVTGLFVVWTVTLPKREVRPEITVSFFDPAPSGVILTDEPARPNQTDPVRFPPANASARPEPGGPTLSERVAALDPNATASGPGSSLSPSRAQREQLMNTPKFPEVRFGGLGSGNAQSIVYVVDAAGSMVTTLDRVKDDLKRSILKLAPTQQFQVIFFQRGTWIPAPHPADASYPFKRARLIRATRDNIRSVVAWIDSVSPAGAGDLMLALEPALKLKPDAVFVLSSLIPGAGMWKPDKAQVLAQLEALNPREIGTGRRACVIKTIQYLDPDPQGILQAIAESHAGKDGYRFIPRSEPPK